MQALTALYEDYLSRFAAARQRHRPVEGLFGFGRGLSEDSCHEQFAIALEARLKDAAAQKPASPSVRQTIEYMLRAPLPHGDEPAVYWMLIAVQVYALPLTAYLDEGDAAAVNALFNRLYPRRERLPAQERLSAALLARLAQ